MGKYSVDDMSEYVYILSNPSMPNLIKVGKTTKHPSKRMSELHSTGVPTPFELEFSVMVDDCGSSELSAHKALSNYRVAGNREFFKISVKKAIELILPVIGNYKIHDVKKSHDIEQICHELARREDERKKIELARQIARQREDERRENECFAKRKPIENKISLLEGKLRLLGQRPIKKELSGWPWFLIMCYWPLPLGWIAWGIASNIFFDGREVIGWLFVGVIVAGYFFNEAEKKNQKEFDVANARFKEIDDVLYELHQQLEKLP